MKEVKLNYNLRYYDMMLDGLRQVREIEERKKMANVTATQILKDAAALKERKSQDYQGGLYTEADYFPYGSKSYAHMIHTKYLRMMSLLDKEFTGDEVNFESLEDTLIDMINYAAMFAAFLENKKVK